MVNFFYKIIERQYFGTDQYASREIMKKDEAEASLLKMTFVVNDRIITTTFDDLSHRYIKISCSFHQTYSSGPFISLLFIQTSYPVNDETTST